MIKHTITNRWTSEAMFTAEIDCGEDAPISLKAGLAVQWAIQHDADSQRADLRHANLRHADLKGADLRHANLRHADLQNANLWDTIGNMREIKSAQFDRWPLTWTTAPDGTVTLQIGCQSHSLAMWEKSDPRWIDALDDDAPAWWAQYRDIVLALVKASPAEPWGT